ncbi:MAG: hypothetical protein AB8U82_06820 [Rickettsia endosymbiont of Haemaphysalis japonica]
MSLVKACPIILSLDIFFLDSLSRILICESATKSATILNQLLY